LETTKLDTKPVEECISSTIAETKEAYLMDTRPWILGYSGGKDSTATLQIVWQALQELSIEERKKPVYVISSDTLVETPIIQKYLYSNIDKINHAAKNQNLPISATILKPKVDETYWVNLIGRGYPAPQQMFRWCTSRLKIRTSSRFIENRISKYGEVVIVLGTRKQESASRKKVMDKLDIEGSIFSRSNQFSAAYSYCPIREWSEWDVWRYLMLIPSPWGNDNKELAQMYREASGECPFVMDDSTHPCGNSRFGCWVCTLVQTDESLISLIESSYDWLKPLMDFKKILVETLDPEKKSEYRQLKLRRGYVLPKKNPEARESDFFIRGPYKFEFRKILLKELLLTQKKISEIGPDSDIQLISKEELGRIRQIWRTEEGDWEDSVPLIYKKVFDDEYWTSDDNNPFNRYDKEKLEKLARDYNIPEKLIIKLIDLELQTQGMAIRHSIYKKMDKIFNEEWRSEEELLDYFLEKTGIK
jgi:DNA sulfur modification protein DndC